MSRHRSQHASHSPESRSGSSGEEDAGPLYRIDERPPRFWETLLYAWQHTLVDISPFVLPLAVASAAGMTSSGQARLINFCLLAMGVATLIQTLWGNRLPIIQGPSATLTGVLAPVAGELGVAAMWGGVALGAAAETLFGFSGIPARLRRLFPPQVTAVVIISIGLALGQVALRLALGQGRWIDVGLASTVVALVFLLQHRFAHRGLLARGAVFFSIWTVGLGVGSLLGEVEWALVSGKPWLQWPSLLPYGGPGWGWEWHGAAVLAILAGYLASMVESIGDYAAVCTVSGEEFRARHIDRGIRAEGLGCLAASVLGGLPCTSYTQNIGIIATTRVASRFVVQIAAVILILYGLCPKFGALLTAMPRSVLGGVFVLVCGMIVVSGIRLLSQAPPSRGSMEALGVSLVAAVALPPVVRFGMGPEWLKTLPDLLRIMLTNTVVLAMVFSVALTQAIRILGRRSKSL